MYSTKSKTKFLLLSITGIMLISCTSNENRTAEQSNANNDSITIYSDKHTTENSIDWSGVYQEILPCTDCPGIKTTIELKKNNTYIKNEEYLDSKNRTFNETGKIVWSENGNNITLTSSDDEKHMYKVTEGSIIFLDNEGNVITGELAENYILKKK